MNHQKIGEGCSLWWKVSDHSTTVSLHWYQILPNIHKILFIDNSVSSSLILNTQSSFFIFDLIDPSSTSSTRDAWFHCSSFDNSWHSSTNKASLIICFFVNHDIFMVYVGLSVASDYIKCQEPSLTSNTSIILKQTWKKFIFKEIQRQHDKKMLEIFEGKCPFFLQINF